MQYKRFVNPPFSECCYLLFNDQSECLVIDPGGSVPEIMDFISERDLSPLAILFTHTHCDHVAGTGPLARSFGIPMYMAEQDRPILETSATYWQFIAKGLPFDAPTWDEMTPFPGDRFSIGGYSIAVIPAPGHTPGSCILRIGTFVLTGDTFFLKKVGRCDLVGGDKEQLRKSIHALPAFEEDDIFLPGHGPVFDREQLLKTNSEFCEIRNS